MQVTNQSFFVEKLERAVAFGVDGVSEVAFNCWKYRDDRAALMVVGCIVDMLANRKFRHRELFARLLQDDPVAAILMAEAWPARSARAVTPVTSGTVSSVRRPI